jgi:hypothetical protein
MVQIIDLLFRSFVPALIDRLREFLCAKIEIAPQGYKAPER